MKLLVLVLLIFTNEVLFSQILDGTYLSSYRRSGKLVLDKKNSYSQKITDCTFGFETSGTFYIKNDTVVLSASKTYNLHTHNGRKRLVQDTANYLHKFAQKHSKYLIRQDTLILLRQAEKGLIVYKSIPLVKQKDK